MIIVLSIKAEVGSKGGPWVGTNGEKWPKIEFSGKCWENGVEIARSSFLFRDIIATAPNDTIFINKSKDVVKRLPISRQKRKKWPKRPKMEYLPIFDHFSPFVPAHAWPLDPTSTFVHLNDTTWCFFNEIYGEKAFPGYYHPIFPPFAWKFNF